MQPASDRQQAGAGLENRIGQARFLEGGVGFQKLWDSWSHIFQHGGARWVWRVICGILFNGIMFLTCGK